MDTYFLRVGVKENYAYQNVNGVYNQLMESMDTFFFPFCIACRAVDVFTFIIYNVQLQTEGN